MIVKKLNNWRKIMKKITISDLDGFTDICECEKMLGELKAGCAKKIIKIPPHTGPLYPSNPSK